MDYEIQYKKGAENKAADALSRRGIQEKDSARGACDSGKHGNLRNQILQQLHSSAVGGHSGQLRCLKRLGTVFYWPGMKKDVVEFVKQCDVCQSNKHENVPYPGLLQPLPVPNQAWSQISMDFIESLPNSEGADTILVVVDRFIKFSHFIPLKHPFSAVVFAQLFLTHVSRLHGLPDVIVSDRDKLFTSLFWQELFRLLGTRLNLSSAYQPQKNGQSERVNQCVETYLRCMSSDRPQKWKSWLPMAEWWYNTNYHTSLKMTPFEALYGYEPN